MDPTDEQLAAFLSITAFRQSYRLWSMYATRRTHELQRLGPPVQGDTAHRYWQVAKDAVIAALRSGGGFKAANLVETLNDAATYKRWWVLILNEAGKEFESSDEVLAARERLELRKPYLMEEVQRFEDKLPPATLAWCRLAALQKVREGKAIERKARRGSLLLRYGNMRGSTAPTTKRGSCSTAVRGSVVPAAGGAAASAPAAAAAEGGGGDGAAAASNATATADGSGGGAAASAEEEEDRGDMTLLDDEQADKLLEKKKNDDIRVAEAPEGYVHSVKSIHLDALVIRLLISPGAAAKVEALGMLASHGWAHNRQALRDGLLGEGVLTLKVTGIDVVVRSLHNIGKATHVVIGGVEVIDGNGSQGEGAPIVYKMHGDELGVTPDEDLGGTVDYPGDIAAFLVQRRMELRKTCLPGEWGGFFGSRSKPPQAAGLDSSAGSRNQTRSRSRTNSLRTERSGRFGGGASPVSLDESSVADPQHHQQQGALWRPAAAAAAADEDDDASTTHHLHAREYTGGYGYAPLSAEASLVRRSPSPPTASPAYHYSTPQQQLVTTSYRQEGSTPPIDLNSLHLRKGPPAIRLSTLSSTVETRPDELYVRLGKMDARYFPAFFAKFDRFTRTLEKAKHASLIGGSAIMRAKFAKLTRTTTYTLAETWHYPEKYLMTGFASVTDLFDMPSSRHVFNLSLDGGFALRLYSEKEVTVDSEELLTLLLPPLRIARTPRVGEPLPPLQKAEITLDGSIQVTTPAMKRVYGRVLQAQHAGTQGYSRMGGRLLSAVYLAVSEVSKYRERLRHLDEEAERLKVLFAGLRARSAASVLSPAIDHLAARDLDGVDLTGLLERERMETAARYHELYPEAHSEGLHPSELHGGEWNEYVSRLEAVAQSMEEYTRAMQRNGPMGDWVNEIKDQFTQQIRSAWGKVQRGSIMGGADQGVDTRRSSVRSPRPQSTVRGPRPPQTYPVEKKKSGGGCLGWLCGCGGGGGDGGDGARNVVAIDPPPSALPRHMRGGPSTYPPATPTPLPRRFRSSAAERSAGPAAPQGPLSVLTSPSTSFVARPPAPAPGRGRGFGVERSTTRYIPGIEASNFAPPPSTPLPPTTTVRARRTTLRNAPQVTVEAPEATRSSRAILQEVELVEEAPLSAVRGGGATKCRTPSGSETTATYCEPASSRSAGLSSNASGRSITSEGSEAPTVAARRVTADNTYAVNYAP